MSERKGQGWFDFAAVMIGLSGIMHGFEGLSALFRKEYFAEGSLVFRNLQVWAWVWLILGVVQIITASALVAGGGRRTAIALCGLSALVAFLSIGAYPLWSLIMLALNVLVIYHLSTSRGADRSVSAFPEPMAQRPAEPGPPMR